MTLRTKDFERRASTAGLTRAIIVLGLVACGFIVTDTAEQASAAQRSRPGDSIIPQKLSLPPCTKPGVATLDVSSGSAGNGNVDPRWRIVSAPSGASLSTPAPAYGYTPSSLPWAAASAPAMWIVPWQGGSWGSTAVNGHYVYELKFNVPAGYSSISVGGQCRADDQGTITVNGNTVPSCSGFSGAVGTFSSPAVVGTNTIQVDVHNGPLPVGDTSSDPTGAMINATVRGMCSPAPEIPEGDHYLCYNLNKPYKTVIDLQDQFGTYKFNVFAITRLCNPVQKRHNNRVYPIRNKNLHYVCYRGETHQVKRQVVTNNQFGPDTLTVVGPTEVCLPSGKMELHPGE